jgi:predicted outer membrane repeat protein
MTRFASRIALVLPLAVLSGEAGAVLIYSVGSGEGCTHGTIQSAIDAADASPGYDVIRLTRSLTYEPEANTIVTDQDLSVVGGFETCTSPASDGFKTTISGAGGAEEPVFRITANGAAIIKLRLLTITNGDEDGAGFGGGIYFRGTGNLEIMESDITNNTAGYGGGILAIATGTNAELIISNNTTISGNTARYSGGGLFIAGPLEMTMTAPSTIIAFNEALNEDGNSGYGGGMEVSGPAIAYIGSPGAFGLPVIYGNSARYGGGISITGGDSEGANALVQLFTTDPTLPVSVSGNSASQSGGGVYAKPWVGFPFQRAFASLCASDFRIDDNLAEDGSAIYTDTDDDGIDYSEGGTIDLNAPGCTHAGATHCAAGVACNTIWGNGASTVGGDPTNGAAIRIGSDGQFDGDRIDMRGNHGGYAVRATESVATLGGCLLADNAVTQQLVRTEDAYVSISNCTLTHNLINSTDVIHAENYLRLFNSIIDQPGNLALAYSGSDLLVSHMLSSDLDSLPSDPTIVTGDPSFVDAANGDYHLRLASPALDFAPPIAGDDRDLDGQPRDQDIAGVPNEFGVRDLGAYERQRGAQDCGAADTIFCNAFEIL